MFALPHFLSTGASWVSWGLVKGAEFTGKAIQKGASKLRERIQPEEKPVEVSPAVSRGLHIARQATGGAAKVSQFLGNVPAAPLLRVGCVGSDSWFRVVRAPHPRGATTRAKSQAKQLHPGSRGRAGQCPPPPACSAPPLPPVAPHPRLPPAQGRGRVSEWRTHRLGPHLCVRPQGLCWCVKGGWVTLGRRVSVLHCVAVLGCGRCSEGLLPAGGRGWGSRALTPEQGPRRE